MRDLLFRNFTSPDRKKKAISSCEIVQNSGIRTIIRRHFVCKALETKSGSQKKASPQIFVRRNCNSMLRQESFFCRMKASVYANINKRWFLILFGYSLKVDSRPV